MGTDYDVLVRWQTFTFLFPMIMVESCDTFD